jgi:heat shock protein HtpX
MSSAYSIQSTNVTKTYGLILVFVLLVVGVFYGLGAYFNNPILTLIGLAIGIIQPLIGYFWGSSLALKAAGATEVSYDQHPQLHEIVENLSRIAGIPKPKVYVANDPSPNAFACGRDPEHAAICVNQGLLELLEKPELEGVIAHEIAHIKNRDILVMTMAAILASIIGIVADLGGRFALFGGGNSDNNNKNPLVFVLYLAIIFLAPLAAFLIQMAVSRSREYLADATAVTFTRYPRGLSSALNKLYSSPVPTNHFHTSTSHFYISPPKRSFGQSVQSWMSTHPPLESRIAALDQLS